MVEQCENLLFAPTILKTKTLTESKIKFYMLFYIYKSKIITLRIWWKEKSRIGQKSQIPLKCPTLGRNCALECQKLILEKPLYEQVHESYI